MKNKIATVLDIQRNGSELYIMAYNPEFGDFEIKTNILADIKKFDKIAFKYDEISKKFIFVKPFVPKSTKSLITNVDKESDPDNCYIEAYNQKWGRFAMKYNKGSVLKTYYNKTMPVSNLIIGDNVMVVGIKSASMLSDYEIASVLPHVDSEDEEIVPYMTIKEIDVEATKLLNQLEEIKRKKQTEFQR